jgi:hypothetical protein
MHQMMINAPGAVIETNNTSLYHYICESDIVGNTGSKIGLTEMIPPPTLSDNEEQINQCKMSKERVISYDIFYKFILKSHSIDYCVEYMSGRGVSYAHAPMNPHATR